MIRLFMTIFLGFLYVGIGVGCGGTDNAQGDGGVNDTDWNITGDGSGSGDGSGNGNGSGNELGGGAVCDEVDLYIERDPVRVMLLQDLSSSMRQDNKWPDARSALNTLLTNQANKGILFGFDAFPSPSRNCNINNNVLRDCEPNNEDNIRSFINSVDPYQSTPLWCGMRNFIEDDYAPKFTSPGARTYLVVISDGRDSCDMSCAGLPGEPRAQDFTNVTNKLREDQGISTFVIGFGNADIDPQQLNAIARAGGTPYDTYFIASDKKGLEDAFNAISGAVIGCSWTVNMASISGDADKNTVNFFVTQDGVDSVVPMVNDCQSQDGWIWSDTDQIEFCGDICNTIKNGDFEAIKANFGCIGSITV